MALTKIRQGDLHKFSPRDQRSLSNLTIADESGMREHMATINRNADSHPVDHKIFVLYEGRAIVAWALAVEDTYSREYDLMFYTRRDKRKKGYGKRLFRKARAWAITHGYKKAYHYNFFPEPENMGFFRSVDPDGVESMGIYAK